jgi:1,4-alpha-glucan branching enzyme
MHRVLPAALVAAVTSASCAAATAARAPVATREGVRFTFADTAATSVSVAGTFNDWSVTAHPLARAGSANVWSRVVMLPAGEHLFMFVVNGKQWIMPPLAEEYVDDGFGAKNGVVIVRPRER